jgi:type VI secretion system protein ImpF
MATTFMRRDGFEPSFLDRLIDSDPKDAHASNDGQDRRDEEDLHRRRARYITELRKYLLRDLEALLYCTNLESVQDLEAYPHAAKSVINFGRAFLVGVSASNFEHARKEIERRLRQAIIIFEPRIRKETLAVHMASELDQKTHNSAVFVIEGELWAQPNAEPIALTAEIDFEAGSVKVIDRTGGSGR